MLDINEDSGIQPSLKLSDNRSIEFLNLWDVLAFVEDQLETCLGTFQWDGVEYQPGNVIVNPR